MKKTIILAVLLIIGLSVQTGFGQAAGDKETLIRMVRLLEEKPFDDNAKKYREWAFLYVVQTKDVSVKVCTDLTKPFMDKKNKYGSELLVHHSIAMAAFKLENPAMADNEVAAQLAGMESTLKSYEAMVKEKPKARFAALDSLAEKRNKGELAAFISANMCK